MVEKKIIDDYYQNQEIINTNSSSNKKTKLNIKGKVKFKKELKDDKKDILNAENIKEDKNIILHDQNQDSEKNTESLSRAEKNKIIKKEYFTKNGEEKKKLNQNKKERITKKNVNVKKELKEENKKIPFKKEEDKISQEKKGVSTKGTFNKEGGYSTKASKEKKELKEENKKISVKKEVKSVSQEKKGSYSTGVINNSNKELFVIKEQKNDKFSSKKGQKNFNDKKQEEKKKFFLKKDKNNKYGKNVIIDEDNFSFSRSSKIKNIKKEEKKVENIIQNLTDRTGETVIIQDILSVKELSEKIGIPLVKLITEFLKNGMKVTINSKIDYDTASIISEIFNIKLQKDTSSGFGIEQTLSGDISSLLLEEDKSLLNLRAPIISIMGHVDHGKTSLLDYIRKTKVADKEAGGITQSIGAYQVEYNGENITFLDTPGHEAFTIMRARGAKSTDIAILVVAGDEGVKPQTIESINHAKEAGIQIIVAINKMDKPGINLELVKTQLASNGLQPEDWGGTTPIVPISAKTGFGIDDLFEIIILSSQLLELKANSNRYAVGTILESHLDMKLGPVSSVLINTGTLKKGDSIVCKGSYGKVKVLKDHYSKNINSAGPSTPVLVVGLDNVCEGGDIIQVVSDIEKARIKALEYKELMISKKITSKSSIDLIMSKIKSGNLKQLKVVLKTDSNGSLEAIKGALLKLSTKETKVMIIHSGVGNITEGDVLMCQGSSAILIGFNVELLGNTRNIIENIKIEYISSKIIYQITDRLEKIITGMLDPREVEVVFGESIVGGIFYDGNGIMILGLKVKEDSKVVKGALVKIIRKNKVIGEGKIENLKSGVIDVNEIEGPVECGIKLKTNAKVELLDLLKIYKIEIHNS